jgi:kynurenine 3-monooxygenase
VTVTYDTTLLNYDTKTQRLALQHTKTGRRSTVIAELVIGADGINSQVRQALDRADGISSVIEELSWGYKNIFIRARGGQPLPLRDDAFHCWPRKLTGMVGMANRGFFTCTLILPLHGENSFDSLHTKPALKTYFAGYYPELSPYIESFAAGFVEQRPTVFRTLRCPRWYYQGQCVLIGDAAHAMTIFMGQGINAAFDDCATLAQLLKDNPADYEAAFRRFQQIRKVNTDTMSDISLQRLVELKDKYGSQLFLAKTQLEMLLERRLPKLWLSQYTLIVHTLLPYAQGLKRYNRQRFIARLLGLDVATLLLGTYFSFRKALRAVRTNTPVDAC